MNFKFKNFCLYDVLKFKEVVMINPLTYLWKSTFEWQTRRALKNNQKLR